MSALVSGLTYYKIESSQDVLERKLGQILAQGRQSSLVVIDSLSALLSGTALQVDEYVAFTPAPRGRLSGLAERLAS
jgi:hypothetical protein